MQLKPEELEEKGYVLLDSMNHTDIVPFVKKFLHKRTWFSSIYYGSVLISFSILLIWCVHLHHLGYHPVNKLLVRAFYGILLLLALIPFHELIHGLAYKITGAKKTSFDMNLRKFYFLAIADRFVVNKKEFQIIALAPFLIISLALIIISFFSGDWWRVTLLTTLMIHTMACSGDFALLSYFEFYRKKEIVTYDDRENKVSFFYDKKS